jgi:hypothetical protein
VPTGIGANSCPIEVGEPKCWEEEIRQSLLEEYSPVFDVSEGTIASVEAAAEAAAVAMIWAASERLAKQSQALRMIEALPIWEEACGLRPSLRDSNRERRDSLAAKFRGYGGNTEADIRQVCSTAMGSAFVAIRHVEPTDVVSYWPGINPGPPGSEWWSNRSMVLAQVTNAGLGDEEFRRRTAKMTSVVDEILTGECVFDWFRWDTDGTDEGFFLDESELDEVGL